MATKKNESPLLKILLVVVSLGALYLGYRYYNIIKINKIKNEILPKVINQVINDPNTKFSIGTVKETNGVYEFELTISGKKYSSYISRDGKLLFPGGVKLDQVSKTNPTRANLTPTPTKTKP